VSQHSIRLLVTCLDPSRRVTGCFGVWGCPQLEKLLEEHNFMRETFGQPTDQELGDFRMKRQIEQQSLRALNSQLESEVRGLEAERRTLRSQLRGRQRAGVWRDTRVEPVRQKPRFISYRCGFWQA
jgi:hypothetical protein